MVEQFVKGALGASDWAYVLDGGRMVASGAKVEMLKSSIVEDIYIGKLGYRH